MKNKFAALILLISFCKSTYSQNPVPNPGFESWLGGNPVNWSTNNIPNVYAPITQTSIANGGSFAAQGNVIQTASITIAPFLSSTDMSGQGFPVTQLYSNFSFYYKFTRVGAVALVPSAALFQSNGTLVSAAGQNISTPSSSFTLISLPFYTFGVNPAKCQIAFTLNDTLGNNIALGNSFAVDDVSISNGVGVEDHFEVFAISKVLPNPANESTFVYYSVPVLADVSFEIMTVTGQSIQRIDLKNELPGKHKMDFNTVMLPSGFYLVKMSSNNGYTTMPFLVNH